MNHNRFFTVEVDESSQETLRVMPTDYLEELHPHKAITEMQEYIETLENAMSQYEGGRVFNPVKVQGIGSLAFELELVRTFLASFKQAYGTMH
jgi:hypothetical protein